MTDEGALVNFRLITGAISPFKTQLHKPRITQEQTEKRKTQNDDSEEGTPYLDSSQECPKRASALLSDVEQIKMY